MTKQKLLLYLLLLMGMVQGAMAQEPYAALSDDNTVLTFYYDTHKAERNGMSVGPFEYSFDSPNTSWYPQRTTITTVVFDASFADCTSLTSTAYWFYNCSNLTSITGIENIKTDNVTSMRLMFTGCSGLTSLDVSGFKNDKVTDMSHMFEACWRLTSLDLSGFKTDNVTSMYRMFYGCSGLTNLDVSGFKTDKVTNMHGMFWGCSGLTSLDVSGFKTDKVTDMSHMFLGCRSLTSLDVSGFKTDNVTDMSNMFTSCSSLTRLDLSGFKTDNVTDMNGMFSGCSGLTSLDVSGFKTDNATVMSGMFSGCSGLTSLDLSGFKTDNVESMSYMFDGCSGLTSLDVSGFKTENVTSMYAMFSGCSGLTSLDVSGFKTDNVTDMDGMFMECSGLTSLDVSGFKTDNVTNMIQMFMDCSSLTNIDVSGFKTDKVTDMSGMFQECSSLTSLDVSGFKTDNVTSMYAMFSGCSGLTSLDVSGFKTDNVEKMSGMFEGCSSLTSLDVSGFKTDNVTNMSHMFNSCHSLTSLDVSGFKTDNVTDMSSMFYYCSSLTSLDVSGFKTNNVTRMSQMFQGCSGLTSLDVSGFKTDNVTDMEGMFSGCSGLTSIDVSGFKTDNVTHMKSMFSGCSGLTSIDVSGFKTDKVTNMDYMFSDCSGLTSLDVSGFKTDNVTNMGSMFWGCSGLTTIYADETKWSTDKVTSGTLMFYNCTKLVGGNGTTYSSEHTDDEYARIDKPGQPGYFTNILDIIGGSAFTLSVTDDRGNDITQDVNIVWYDGDGKQIGKGSKLNGVAKNADVFYSVLMEESLGRVYREVNMRKADADEEGSVTCQLEKIGRVTLEGRVSATDIDKTTATVSVRQMLNGKWQQDYSTQTDRQGVFSIEVYDDVTDITISGDGYLDATLHRDSFDGSGNVGTIPVNLLSGFAIAANVSMEQAVVTGEAPQVTAWTDGLTNIDFNLTNLTKGTALTAVAVQGGNVVIKSGAAVGDEIKLTAVSKQGVFADVETTFTIAEGANSFDLQLTELGGIDATCTASSNGTTVGYLYDHDDRLAARGSYRGETLTLRHLKSGTYTLVSMGQSLLLGSMTSLADLNAVGLSEGADYVATRIDVADGELTAVSISDVPRLDETPFYYTNANTYFNAGQASVTAGNYITLQAHVDLKPEHADKANGVTLTIDLPEGCQMVENSVIANRQAVPHTVSGNRVTMTLAKEQYESEVRFCVMPTLNQSYTVTAMATFDIDGQVQQPIGTALFEAKGLSLRTPKYTSSTTVTINGTAKGHSEVSIYDNDVLVGTTTSKADGSWTAQSELYKPYSHSFHDIYAKIVTEDGLELTSETKQVEYDKTGIVPTTVTMMYRSSHVKFDLLQGTTTPTYYSFVHGTGDFTFLADFTRNDSTVVKNVSIKVLNSDGTVRTLPATFDSNQGKWVATTRYSSSSRLPQNVTVDYNLISTLSDADREEPMLDMATEIITIANKVNEAIEDKVELNLLEEETSKLIYDYKVNGSDDSMIYQMEILDYASAVEMLNTQQFLFAEMDGDTIATFTDYTNSTIEVVNINMTEKIASRTILSDNENKYQNSPDRRASKAEMFKYLLLNPLNIKSFSGIGADLLDFLGMKDYLSVGSDFKMMCQIIIDYQAKYEMAHQNAFNLILAKCPDGSRKLSDEQIEKYNNALNALSDVESAFADQYYVYLQDYKKKLAASVLTFSVTFTVGKLMKLMTSSDNFVFRKFNQDFLKTNFNKFMYYNASRKTVAEIFGNFLGIGINAAPAIVNNYKDFNAVRDNTLSWASSENNKIISDYVELINGIKKAYKSCEKDKDENDDQNSDDKSDFNGNGTTPIIDPSGYVYEAVLSNRLEGVTTTCYEQVNGSAVLWNAEDYSQQNPLRTDETGFYRWDVPQGMWQVKYEKEGYETAYSEWLPVPPPQLDVNIGMKQSTPPTVKQMRGYEEGITVEMAKYMRPETMTTANITVTRNGSPETGSIVALNTEQAPLGEETYVSKVRFVPETGFNSTDQVVVTVHKEVESYCGVQMTADHVETVKIETEVKSIVADETVSVPYQGERELRVVVLPKGAAAGKTLRVNSSSQMIAAVSASEVVIGQDGLATLTVNGRLPGGAVLDFSIDGSDVTATTKVQVVMGRDMVATPTASIASGETVNSGTMLTLSSATPGATIYYTLDGSCPCDEATRIRYEAPIAITESVVVKAIAVKDGMDDSDVATFIYVLTGIGSSKLDGQVRVACHDRVLTVTGAEGGSCQIYDLNGRELSSRNSMGSEARFHLQAADVCLVHIRLRNGQSAVYKIQVR